MRLSSTESTKSRQPRQRADTRPPPLMMSLSPRLIPLGERERQDSENKTDAQDLGDLEIDERDVIERLNRRVHEPGDPNAARELRAWLDRANEQAPEELDLDALTRREAKWMLARLHEQYERMTRGAQAFRLLGP